jgi:hypothetical protein
MCVRLGVVSTVSKISLASRHPPVAIPSCRSRFAFSLSKTWFV